MTQPEKKLFTLWQAQKKTIENDLKACQAGIYDSKCLLRLEMAIKELNNQASGNNETALVQLTFLLAQLIEAIRKDRLALNLFLIDLIQRSFDTIENYILAITSKQIPVDQTQIEEELQKTIAHSSQYAIKKVGHEITIDKPEVILSKNALVADDPVTRIHQNATDETLHVEGSLEPHIPVNPEKLDNLFDIFHEMLSIRSELSLTHGLSDEKAGRVNALEKLDQLIQSANNYAMALQTQTIEPLFKQVIDIIKQRCGNNHKNIIFSVIGSEIKIDKRIVIDLGKALLELVDNAAFHGIEESETRQEMGKPREGHIRLEACYHASRLKIIIADDGRGILWEKLVKIAEQYGIIADKDAPDGKADETQSFESHASHHGKGGFATVKDIVQSLKGEIRIYAPPRLGTRVTMLLPLNQTMVEGLITTVKDQSYILPISDIVESIAVNAEDIHWVDERQSMIQLRDQWFPAIALSALLGEENFTQDSFKTGRKILIRIDPTIHQPEVMIIVDALESQRQVLVQSLEKNFQAVHGISGVAFLQEGQTALVVDIDSLLNPHKYS
ncbi:MAG: chemotaxis protein CheW [Zymomonas mobilis]|uniref:chemotaxis protein CheW n=1 Tax=Zymomonas mobilis TaxID=542 RepID=UPI0039ED0621